MKRSDRVMLWTVAVGGIGMGAYHYVLPFQFRWLEDIHPTHGMVSWSLIMVNFCFSTLLVLLSLLVAIVARGQTWSQLSRAIVVAAGAFWLLNAVFQVAVPMPVPPTMKLVAHTLQLFAIVLTLSSILPVVRSYKLQVGR